MHVAVLEQGLIMPGLLINCGDSHTSTDGAFGLGATEVPHVLAAQTIWPKKPIALRIHVNGARGHAVKYTGSTICALSMEGRMTLSNLSTQGGARFGTIAPEQKTCAYCEERPFAPQGHAGPKAVKVWSELHRNIHASFDAGHFIDAHDIAPSLIWGTSPEQAVPISGSVPDPA